MSPDAVDAVIVKDLVGTDEGRALFEGFGNQKAVEWITVVTGEACGALKGSLAQGEEFETH